MQSSYFAPLGRQLDITRKNLHRYDTFEASPPLLLQAQVTSPCKGARPLEPAGSCLLHQQGKESHCEFRVHGNQAVVARFPHTPRQRPIVPLLPLSVERRWRLNGKPKQVLGCSDLIERGQLTIILDNRLFAPKVPAAPPRSDPTFTLPSPYQQQLSSPHGGAKEPPPLPATGRVPGGHKRGPGSALYLGSDLVPALASLDVHDLPHGA